MLCTGERKVFSERGQAMKPITTLLAAILLATSPAMASTFYRWVDDNGVTHYSEQPPQGRQSEAVRTWGRPSSDQQGALERREAEREAGRAARAEAGENAAEPTASTPPAPRPPAEYCEQHRRNLQVLTDRPVVRRTDPETGEVTTLDAEQRQQMIEQTQDALKACS